MEVKPFCSKIEPKTLMEDLETQEIEGGLQPDQYSVLLTLYLLDNDLLNAKALWKRMPTQAKQSNVELQRIWMIGQKLWVKDYVGAYAAMKQDWSEHVRSLMIQLHQSIKQRLISLVAKAYTSIRVSDFSSLIDCTIDETVALARDKGWALDATTQIVQPVVEVVDCNATLNNERQLQLLADYVSFLEN